MTLDHTLPNASPAPEGLPPAGPSFPAPTAPGRSVLTGNDRSSTKSCLYLAIASAVCMHIREAPHLQDFCVSAAEYEDRPRLTGRLGTQLPIQHCPLHLGDLDLDVPSADGSLATHSYEPLLEAVRVGGHLGDLPANGLRGLVRLLTVTGSTQLFLGDGAGFSLAVPATLDPVAMNHARAAAEAALLLAPRTRVWVYEVDAKGSFASLGPDDDWVTWRRRMEHRHGRRVAFRSIPFAPMANLLLPLWQLDELPELTAERLLSRAPGLRRLEAATYARQLVRYGQATLEAVSDQARWFLGLDD